MKAKIGDTVRVEYEGFFDNGEVFDSTKTQGGEPLEFKIGEHQVVPGFENAIIGKELDQEFQIRIEPKDAYGPHDPKAVQEISRADFPADIKPEIGMMLVLEQKHGDHSHQIPVVIKDVDKDRIILDFNHPMAGKTLNFKIKLVQIN